MFSKFFYFFGKTKKFKKKKKGLNRDQADSLNAENVISTLKKLEHYLNFQDQQVNFLKTHKFRRKFFWGWGKRMPMS